MAGFFKRLFGSGTSSTSRLARGSQMSLYEVAMRSTEVSPQQCGACGVTFPNPKQVLSVIGGSAVTWKLDVGGYCPKCRMYRCPNHAKLAINEIATADAHKRSNEAAAAGLYVMAVRCGACGSDLEPGP